MPSFVGNDYLCDTGIRGSSWAWNHFYADDPLWDGQGCESNSTCCEFNSPPWFCKQLPQPTTDDIEMRICYAASAGNDDTPFEKVDVYVR